MGHWLFLVQFKQILLPLFTSYEMCVSPIWWTKEAIFVWIELRTTRTPSTGSHPSTLGLSYWPWYYIVSGSFRWSENSFKRKIRKILFSSKKLPIPRCCKISTGPCLILQISRFSGWVIDQKEWLCIHSYRHVQGKRRCQPYNNIYLVYTRCHWWALYAYIDWQRNLIVICKSH